MPRLNVVLVEPEIPPNTGNVARLCLATNSVLHLVHPLGFKIDDRHLKRAGLDYWPYVELVEHQDLNSFLKKVPREKLLFFSKKAQHLYTEAPYSPGCYLVFGKETVGLPENLLKTHWDKTFRIPIWGRVRSLNLATSVAVVVYEAYKRLGIFCNG